MATLICIWDAPGSKLATWPTATFALYTDTHCVTALHSYTTLYSAIHYTAIQLYSAIHSTTSTTPLWPLTGAADTCGAHEIVDTMLFDQLRLELAHRKVPAPSPAGRVEFVKCKLSYLMSQPQLVRRIQPTTRLTRSSPTHKRPILGDNLGRHTTLTPTTM